MKTVSLSTLSQTERFSVFSLFAMKQSWPEGHTFVMRLPRKQSALLWFCGACGRVREKDGRVTEAKEGDLLSIPEGSEYAITFERCHGDVSTLLVEFCLFAEEPLVLTERVSLLSPPVGDGRVAEALLSLAALFTVPARPQLEIRSRFYALLSLLAQGEELRDLGRRGFAAVQKGIRYLLLDEEQALSLDEVAAMCYVTPAYFRRMFRAYTGVSPSRYRIRHRTARAKALLDNSPLSIEEISSCLGFESSSYFCRAFKRETGVSPTEYRKRLCIEK